MAEKVKGSPKVNNILLESQWETRRTQWTVQVGVTGLRADSNEHGSVQVGVTGLRGVSLSSYLSQTSFECSS